MTLRAIAAKVILKPEPAPERVIVRPDNVREDSFRIGRVLSIGADAHKALPELEEGARVLYVQSVACTTAVRERAIVHFDHVICVIADDAKDVVASADPRGAKPVVAPIERKAATYGAGAWTNGRES